MSETGICQKCDGTGSLIVSFINGTVSKRCHECCGAGTFLHKIPKFPTVIRINCNDDQLTVIERITEGLRLEGIRVEIKPVDFDNDDGHTDFTIRVKGDSY